MRFPFAPSGRSLRVIGLMSGTSADGADVVLADIDAHKANLRAFSFFPYPVGLRREIFQLFAKNASADQLCRMNFVLGEFFAAAVLKFCRCRRLAPAAVDLIGSHGQTVRHFPPRSGASKQRGSTLQIGEPCVIAERTGITTVADFRPRDMAAGGQGAPLVPYADWFVFRDRKADRVLLNIGGIANITWLPAGGALNEIIAFDTGPGNMILDRLVWRLTAGGKSFDAGGRLAKVGKTDERLLAAWRRHPFFKRRPPKSTGREDFGVEFADALWAQARRARMNPNDLLATATTLTARTIMDACRRFLPRSPAEIIVCGGGAKNATLLRLLRTAAQKSAIRLRSPEDFGVPAKAREALAFAILAWATAMGLPGNAPAATGAEKSVVLGKIIPGRTKQPLRKGRG
jgi:anhydro-N-acetylmuramic acid kinase